MLNRDPERAAQKEAEREAARQQQEAARLAEERRKAEAAFAASPAGRARAAKQADAGFFQIALPLANTTAVFGMSNIAKTQRQERVYTGILASIEVEGWRLENVGYVYEQTGAISRDKMLSSGQEIRTTGQVLGIYLFRNSDTGRTR